jgi:hypothetical protein
MEETIIKVVTQAILELKLSNQLERLDRWISDLTDRVATLEVQPAPAPNKDANGSNDDELDVYDANGNLDNTATMQSKLMHHLQINTQGMGGVDTTTTIEVTIIKLLMIVMLRLSLLYLILMDIMMMRHILIGR